jgi:hypothetical protein
VLFTAERRRLATFSAPRGKRSQNAIVGILNGFFLLQPFRPWPCQPPNQGRAGRRQRLIVSFKAATKRRCLPARPRRRTHNQLNSFQRRHVRTVFRASRKTVRTMQLLGFLISVCFFSDYLQVSTFSGGLCAHSLDREVLCQFFTSPVLRTLQAAPLIRF